MNPEIIIALIEAAGTILSSIIGVAGVFLIVKNRQDIIKLSKEIESYHKHEGNLVKKILEFEGREPTTSMIQNRRGSLRTELTPKSDEKPSMTSQQARKLRKKYLSF